MRCNECEFETNCSLREIAHDITGCTGHSKVRKLKENEVRCWWCRNIVDKAETYQDKKYKNIYMCFSCCH